MGMLIPKTAPRYSDIATLYDSLGIFYRVKGGVQPDIQVALNRAGEQRHICNFACGTEKGGAYQCPADMMLAANRGIQKSTLVKAANVVQSVRTFNAGIKLAHRLFVENGHFDAYCESAEIEPKFQSDLLRLFFKKTGITNNIFGGNPLSRGHETVEIIRALNQDPTVEVNLTTVGEQSITDPAVMESLRESQPKVIALSLDDVEGADALEEMLSMTPAELAVRFHKLPVQPGQARKVPAAIHMADRAAREGWSSKILFNNVVGRKNIGWIVPFERMVAKRFPGALMNFYFSQEAFLGQPGAFMPGELELAEEFVHRKIRQSLIKEPHITMRIHFWWMLAAVFEAFRGDYQRLSNAIGGAEVWTCYRAPTLFGQMSGAFGGLHNKSSLVQIAKVPKAAIGDVQLVGNCFWETGTVNTRVPLRTSEEVAWYLLSGRQELATKVGAKACEGCGFPRQVDEELAMAPALQPDVKERYLQIRDDHIDQLLVAA